MTFRLDVRPVRYASNPIIALGGGGSLFEEQIFDFSIIPSPSDATVLWMYASMMASPAGGHSITIGRWHSPAADRRSWTFDGQVLGPTGGAWDSQYVRCGTALNIGGTVYLYYSGTDGAAYSAGLATSADGGTFTKHASNPLITASGQGRDDGGIVAFHPAILKEGSSWHCVYSYDGDWSGGLKGIRYAGSSDGNTWTKSGGDLLVTRPRILEYHQLLKIDGLYHVFYEAGTRADEATTAPYRIFLATCGTPSGAYTDLPSGPILKESGVGSFDTYHVATPCYMPAYGELFYCGAGSHFEPYDTNPWPAGVASFGNRPFGFGGRRGGR